MAHASQKPMTDNPSWFCRRRAYRAINRHCALPVFVLGLVCASVFATEPTVATLSGGSFATTEDGASIYYDAIGEGTTILIIAGGPGGDSSRFRYTHKLLRPCGRLVYIDNRGRGRSKDMGNNPGPYTLEKDVLDVEAVRMAIRAERVVVYGHSYGSMVAIAYASTYPSRTIALITSGGVHGARVWQERNIDGVKRYLRDHYPKRWARVLELHDAGHLTSEGELAEFFRNLEEIYTYNPESDARLAAQFDEYRDPESVSFNPNVYRIMVGNDPEWIIDGMLKGVELLPALARYKGPALIMGGRFDRICPPINQIEIAATLPSAVLVIFERSGHSPFTEEPLRFLGVVQDFLRGLDPVP